MELATALGLSMSAGLSAFMPIFIIGCLARFTDWVTLPVGFQFLLTDWVLLVSGLLALIEIVADKVPTVDHVWDAVQTFIRPVAGAVLAIAAFGQVDPVLIFFAGLLGGSMASTVHASKSSLRVLSTSSTGGVANPFISLFEDILTIIGTVLSLVSPIIMLIAAAIFLFIAIWVLPMIFNFLVFRFMMCLSWVKWQLTKPMTIGDKPPYLYRISSSQLPKIEKCLEPGEKIQTALQGQVWLRQNRKIVFLIFTGNRLIIRKKGLFAREFWSYDLSDIVSAKIQHGISVSIMTMVKDQAFTFEFYKTATPYVEYIHHHLIPQKERLASASIPAA